MFVGTVTVGRLRITLGCAVVSYLCAHIPVAKSMCTCVQITCVYTKPPSGAFLMLPVSSEAKSSAFRSSWSVRVQKGKNGLFSQKWVNNPISLSQRFLYYNPGIKCVASLGSSLSCAVCNSQGSPAFGLSKSTEAKVLSCLLKGSAA